MTRRGLLRLVGVCPAAMLPAPAAEAADRTIQTVTGPLAASDLGTTLMHEHVVTDLRAPAERRPGDYNREEAFEIALPYLRNLHRAGCRSLVETTPIHIGRDPVVLKRLSEAAGLNIIAATGIYGAANQKFIPEFAHHQSAEQLADRYVREFHEGIGTTGIRPGIIKTGVNRDTPLPAIERKLVRAAVLAHKKTGLTVASHTGPGAGAAEELEIFRAEGADPSAFIWVHAQNEKDHALHIKLAREGVWVEFDGVRESSLDWHLECVQAMAEAGLLHRTLISQDAGWYRPGEPSGGNYRGYTLLLTDFLPRLRQAGLGRGEIQQLMITNPRLALTGPR